MALTARSFRLVPRPTSTIADNNQRKEIRSVAPCVQQCGIACQEYSNWRTKCLRRNFMQHARICTTGPSTGDGRKLYAVPVDSQETCSSDSSSHRRISIRDDASEQEAGYFGIQAAGGSPKWMSLPVHVLGSILVGTLVFGVASANATDALKTCACLLKECRVEFARCLTDPGCAANIACLQTCNNRPDETTCQIGCGDLFDNAVVDQFNDCAVSRKGCVPQKQDDGLFPLPPTEALVPHFNTQDFAGQWYISSGLNKTFDTFNCQLHEFTTTPPDKITGKLLWRVPTPDGGFIQRNGVQNFVQDKKLPGALYNHDNPALHYKDDWYILAAKTQNTPDDYIFVYYRGSNDAWDGYGGAVVYTRSKTLPPAIVPELTSAAKRVGLDFKKFTSTDNSCEAEPPLVARLEKKIEEGEQYLFEEAEEEEMFLVQGVKKFAGSIGKFVGDIVTADVNFFGKLFSTGEDEFKREEELILNGLGAEERALLDALKMEAKDIEQLFSKPVLIRKAR